MKPKRAQIPNLHSGLFGEADAYRAIRAYWPQLHELASRVVDSRLKEEAKKRTRAPRLVECGKPKQAVMLFKLLGYAGILPGAENLTAATLARITGESPKKYEKALERVKPGDFDALPFGDLFEDAIALAEKDLEKPRRKAR